MMVSPMIFFLRKAEQGKRTLRWEDNVFGMEVKIKER